MAPTLHSLGIDKLSLEHRLDLVQAIWDSIVAEAHPPLLHESQRQELQRRAAEDDAKPDDVVSWDQVKSQTLCRSQP